MNVAHPNLVPATIEPKTHNHLLGDQVALWEAMDRDGYWFFRDVLDKDAVARFRRVYTDELEKLGVIDPVGDAPTENSVCPNGRPVDVDLINPMPIERSGVWQSFVEEKPIHDFLVQLLGEDPFWKPITVYRATMPDKSTASNRITGYHQDGPTTPGVDFLTMWTPLATVDWDVGGITFAEGLTEHVNLAEVDETGSSSMILPENMPEGCLRHTTYRPGDVLFMHCWTPHSGLTNVSDRFRLSLDHRVIRPGTKRPYVGAVLSISPDRIELRDDSGATASVAIDDTTYVRATATERIFGQEIVEAFPPGTRVIVAEQNGVATMVRLTHHE
jgi:ectoine hydroxylase-related dioxygenase (phytanoyl-CoA dioxygenase family)